MISSLSLHDALPILSPPDNGSRPHLHCLNAATAYWLRYDPGPCTPGLLGNVLSCSIISCSSLIPDDPLEARTPCAPTSATGAYANEESSRLFAASEV